MDRAGAGSYPGAVRGLEPGDEFGGYRIEALAGRGGMGLVYRAWQRRPERLVAIKVIAPELAADPGFRTRFEQESATAAQIEHPNVIPVYEVGEHDDLLYIAMRYVDGVDLGRLLREGGRLAPSRAADIAAQIAAALDAAHARGLVHRDVKPGNILVAAGDHIYLTDFGLTKRIAETRGMTKTGMFVGTLDYIAPEQVEGRRVDARTDVYALGCVLYEMLSGTVPFPRDSDIAKLFAHVSEPVPRLENVPAPLADAVQRAMAKVPADRFSSAGDLGRAVVAGAAGSTLDETERAVATGEAAIRDTDARTVADARAPTELAVPATQPASATEEAIGAVSPTEARAPGGDDPGSLPRPARSREPRRIRPWAMGGAALLAVAAVGVVIAVAASGSGKTTSSSSSSSSTSSTTSTTSTASRPAPTATRIFSPVNATGGLAVSVTKRTSGACFGGSIVATRSDAWRCSVGNVILDPCFTVDQSHVLCPSSGPWTNSGVLVSLPAGLPTGLADKDQGTSGQPWAIQLASGAQCLSISGATTVVGGQRLAYNCANGLGLYGNVERSGSVWMIYTGAMHSAQIKLEPIATAWF